MATKSKSTKTKRIKDKGILIRVTEAQKKVLAEAAKKEGLGVSSWMLSVALREIERKANAASAAGR